MKFMLNFLFVVLVVCKVCNFTDISWWMVFLPLIVRWIIIILTIAEIAFSEVFGDRRKAIVINITRKKKDDADKSDADTNNVN